MAYILVQPLVSVDRAALAVSPFGTPIARTAVSIGYGGSSGGGSARPTSGQLWPRGNP